MDFKPMVLLGKNWPIIKRIAGLKGDVICRENNVIFINDIAVAKVMRGARNSVILPQWTGCRTLSGDEVFLLNDHPMSLDGRYFGPEKSEDLLGTAFFVWGDKGQ